MIAIQYLLSLIFIVQMYVMMLFAGIVCLPFALFSREAAYLGTRLYSRYIRWSARVICGLKSEVRGEIPTDEVLIASKHQSFLDIIILVSVLPHPKFIMKSSLRMAPVLGWYALRIGCVPVERGKRAEAIKQMMRDVTSGDAPPGQLVIFPQGTRVAPGATLPYKSGVIAIYEQTGQRCVPVACNVGMFWPRQGLLRRRGTAVIEFLPALEPGLPRAAFRAEMEQRIERASNALMIEGGFPVDDLPAID